MDYSEAFAISAAGMSLERARVEVAALNLANANTAGPAGSIYQPLRVVAETGAARGDFANQVNFGLGQSAGAVQALLPQAMVTPSGAAPRLVYEPGHPSADARGFVSYPGVDAATEMVSMMGAMRAYEANVAAMNVSRTLALRALDIGSSS